MDDVPIAGEIVRTTLSNGCRSEKVYVLYEVVLVLHFIVAELVYTTLLFKYVVKVTYGHVFVVLGKEV